MKAASSHYHEDVGEHTDMKYTDNHCCVVYFSYMASTKLNKMCIFFKRKYAICVKSRVTEKKLRELGNVFHPLHSPNVTTARSGPSQSQEMRARNSIQDSQVSSKYLSPHLLLSQAHD